jgi:exocyst complex protein 7
MKLMDALAATSNQLKGLRSDLKSLFVVNNTFYISQALKQLALDFQTPSSVVSAAIEKTIEPKVAMCGEKAFQAFVQARYIYR